MIIPVKILLESQQTGIDMVNKDRINIYPNPTSGLITIELEDLTYNELNILVTDVLGKVVYTKQLDAINVNEELDLSNHTSGVYFVKVYNDKFSKTELIILE